MKFKKFYLIFGLIMAMAVPAFADDSDPMKWNPEVPEDVGTDTSNDDDSDDTDSDDSKDTKPYTGPKNRNGMDFGFSGTSVYNTDKEDLDGSYQTGNGASISYSWRPGGKKAGSEATAGVAIVGGGPGSGYVDFPGDNVQIGIAMPHMSLTEFCKTNQDTNCVRIHAGGQLFYYGKQDKSVVSGKVGVTPMLFERKHGNTHYGFGLPVSIAAEKNSLLTYYDDKSGQDHDVEIVGVNIGGLMFYGKDGIYAVAHGSGTIPLSDTGIAYTTNIGGRIQYGKPGSPLVIYGGISHDLASHKIVENPDAAKDDYTFDNKSVDAIKYGAGINLMF